MASEALNKYIEKRYDSWISQITAVIYQDYLVKDEMF